MPLPPSISKHVPVINLASSLARKRQQFATSTGSVSLPSGTLNRNFLKFSSLGGTPTKVSNLPHVTIKTGLGTRRKAYNPVALRRGQIELTRICFSPYSAARPLVACFCQLKDCRKWDLQRTLATAALLALYQTSPGLGLVAPIEAMLIMEPPSPWLMRLGIKCLAEWKMLLTFTAKTLSNSSSVTSAVGYTYSSDMPICEREVLNIPYCCSWYQRY